MRQSQTAPTFLVYALLICVSTDFASIRRISVFCTSIFCLFCLYFPLVRIIFLCYFINTKDDPSKKIIRHNNRAARRSHVRFRKHQEDSKCVNDKRDFRSSNPEKERLTNDVR